MKIEFPDISKYERALNSLAKTDAIIKFAAYPAAGMVIEAIKDNTPVDSGDLKKSTILTSFEEKNGYLYTQVKWEGYDHKHAPNPVKAYVLERGSSTRKKHPFVKPAVQRVAKAAVLIMEQKLDEYLRKTMRKG